MPKGDKLLPKHFKFVDGLLEGKSQTQAYIDAGYSEKNANKLAYRLMVNDGIRHEYERRRQENIDTARRILEADAIDSVETIIELRQSGTKEDYCRLKAAQDVLDRAGLKPIEQQQVEHGGELRIINEFLEPDNTRKTE